MLKGDLFRAIAIDPELDGVDLRVFLYLCFRLDFENFNRVPQTEIATALGRRKEHISRAIRKLESKQILIPGGKVERSSTWRMNPKYPEKHVAS